MIAHISQRHLMTWWYFWVCPRPVMKFFLHQSLMQLQTKRNKLQQSYVLAKHSLFDSAICDALQPKKEPTPNALPAQPTYHLSIKRNHEASQCSFNKLSASLLPLQPSNRRPPRVHSHQRVYKLFTLHRFVKPTTRPQMGGGTDRHCWKLAECRWSNIPEDSSSCLC